jgi:hypothetical protein
MTSAPPEDADELELRALNFTRLPHCRCLRLPRLSACTVGIVGVTELVNASAFSPRLRQLSAV